MINFLRRCACSLCAHLHNCFHFNPTEVMFYLIKKKAAEKKKTKQNEIPEKASKEKPLDAFVVAGSSDDAMRRGCCSRRNENVQLPGRWFIQAVIAPRITVSRFRYGCVRRASDAHYSNRLRTCHFRLCVFPTRCIAIRTRMVANDDWRFICCNFLCKQSQMTGFESKPTNDRLIRTNVGMTNRNDRSAVGWRFHSSDSRDLFN